MNKPTSRPIQWTQINTSETNEDTGEEFQLDLSKEINESLEEEKPTNVTKESQDTRRGILTVSSPKEVKAKEDDEDQSEETEDQTCICKRRR